MSGIVDLQLYLTKLNDRIVDSLCLNVCLDSFKLSMTMIEHISNAVLAQRNIHYFAKAPLNTMVGQQMVTVVIVYQCFDLSTVLQRMLYPLRKFRLKQPLAAVRVVFNLGLMLDHMVFGRHYIEDLLTLIALDRDIHKRRTIQ